MNKMPAQQYPSPVRTASETEIAKMRMHCVRAPKMFCKQHNNLLRLSSFFVVDHSDDYYYYFIVLLNIFRVGWFPSGPHYSGAVTVMAVRQWRSSVCESALRVHYYFVYVFIFGSWAHERLTYCGFAAYNVAAVSSWSFVKLLFIASNIFIIQLAWRLRNYFWFSWWIPWLAGARTWWCLHSTNAE